MASVRDLGEWTPVIGEAKVRSTWITCGEGNNKTFLQIENIWSNKSNRKCTLQNQDPVLNECAARLGVSLRQTEDQLTSSMLASTASFINCVGGVNGDVPTELTRSDVDEVVRALLGNNAYTIMDNIEGDLKFGTAPVRDAYFALCHTDLTVDMDNIAGFIQKNQYPSPMNALRSEWGSIGRVVADVKSWVIDLEPVVAFS